VAEDIRYQLEQQEFIQNTRVSFTGRQPEITLNFDQILLTSYGITVPYPYRLSELNREFSSGTTFKVGEESFDIIIRDATVEEEELERLRKRQSMTCRLYRS
jgi:multidrug efflux pump subunit AcrB